MLCTFWHLPKESLSLILFNLSLTAHQLTHLHAYRHTHTCTHTHTHTQTRALTIPPTHTHRRSLEPVTYTRIFHGLLLKARNRRLVAVRCLFLLTLFWRACQTRKQMSSQWNSANWEMPDLCWYAMLLLVQSGRIRALHSPLKRKRSKDPREPSLVNLVFSVDVKHRVY